MGICLKRSPTEWLSHESGSQQRNEKTRFPTGFDDMLTQFRLSEGIPWQPSISGRPVNGVPNKHVRPNREARSLSTCPAERETSPGHQKRLREPMHGDLGMNSVERRVRGRGKVDGEKGDVEISHFKHVISIYSKMHKKTHQVFVGPAT